MNTFASALRESTWLPHSFQFLLLDFFAAVLTAFFVTFFTAFFAVFCADLFADLFADFVREIDFVDSVERFAPVPFVEGLGSFVPSAPRPVLASAFT